LGADLGVGDVGVNFAIAVAGQHRRQAAVVTLTRTSQAIGSGDTDGPTR
jgi:hypothetical protein